MKNLSDVRICITKREMKILKNAMKKVDSNLMDICDIKKEFIGSDGLKYIFLSWRNIEWFKSYVDIWLIETILIDFKRKNIPFNFIKISRNNDIEHKFCYDTKFAIDTGMIMQMVYSMRSRRS